MRKLAPAAFIVSGTLVFGGLFLSTPAYAADDEGEKSSVSTETHETEKPEKPQKPERLEPHPDKVHRELEEKYGKEGRLSVPPLVIRPKRETDAFISTPNGLVEIKETDSDASPDTSVSSGTKAATTNKGLIAPSTGTPGSTVDSSIGSSVGSASAGFIAINPAKKSGVTTQTSGVQVFPEQNLPIDISHANFERQTPADVFIQAAQVGLIAMAGGAVVLGGVAASRAIRRK